MNENISALILAGGHSERMNFPKAFLELYNTTLLHSLVGTYHQAGIRRITVVLNHRYCSGEWGQYIEPIRTIATILPNTEPDKGRFHSLRLGAEVHQGDDFCFIHNVDNPFLSEPLIQKKGKRRAPHIDLQHDIIPSPSYHRRGDKLSYLSAFLPEA